MKLASALGGRGGGGGGWEGKNPANVMCGRHANYIGNVDWPEAIDAKSAVHTPTFYRLIKMASTGVPERDKNLSIKIIRISHGYSNSSPYAGVKTVHTRASRFRLINRI